MSTKRVVVVGGGFAGLSAAYTLKKRGITPLVLEAKDHAGGRGGGERVDGFSLDMGAFVFTTTYDTAFRICEELGLPLVESTMVFGHHRNGRWVTTTPDQSLRNYLRQIPAAVAMGFLSPSGLRAGSKVMRQLYRQEEYLSFASDSQLAEIDDDETYGDYLKRHKVPDKLKVTLSGPLKMVLGDARRNAPPGSALPGDDEGLFFSRVPLGRGPVHGQARDARRDGEDPPAACRAHRQPASGRRLHGHPVSKRRPLQRPPRRNPSRKRVGLSAQLNRADGLALAAMRRVSFLRSDLDQQTAVVTAPPLLGRVHGCHGDLFVKATGGECIVELVLCGFRGLHTGVPGGNVLRVDRQVPGRWTRLPPCRKLRP